MTKPSRQNRNKKLIVDKKQCQYWHIKKRAKERLGLNLTDELYNKIINLIRTDATSGDIAVAFKELQSNRLLLYNVKMNNYRPFDVVYDKQRHSLVTILFEEETVKKIYHYIDVFGNKIPTSDLTGKFWKYDLNTKDLLIEGEEVTKIGDDTWSTGQNLNKKVFKLSDDILYEEMV